ncbi:MAG TPA: hypothetical protein PLB73_08220, partial [Leptospiraceae bacterium]|nr:hypothetical protein [Leptospiraceae bacterium]
TIHAFAEVLEKGSFQRATFREILHRVLTIFRPWLRMLGNNASANGFRASVCERACPELRIKIDSEEIPLL